MKALLSLPLLTAIALISPVVHACAQEQPPQVDSVYTRAGESFHTEKNAGIDKRFEPVIAALVADGWSEEWVRQKFSDTRTVFIPKMVKVGIKKPSSGKNYYTWVNTEESAEACRAFINKYREAMESAEAKYGVDKEMIAALIRCETRHGEVTGDYHVFSVYASMALLDKSEYLDANFDNAREQLGKASKKTVASQLSYIENRSKSRAKWAYKELTNMLKMAKSEHVPDMLGIYGSWAGAFGLSQFLPSSYLLRAVDGNGDGKIDLFTPEDAIHSAANYLDKAGYRKGDAASQRKALRNYNNSTQYVNSIYGLAERLKKGSETP
jgi:membrane-bound lytic murein transglycosylase B